MLLYNISQVAINGWMVWRFVDAVLNKHILSLAIFTPLQLEQVTQFGSINVTNTWNFLIHTLWFYEEGWIR